jgi:predicted negative regulator of RcsB-dependent stress response
MKKNKSDLIIDEEEMKQYVNKISSFINNNKMIIIITFFAAISVISGSLIYTGIKKSNNEKASFILYQMIDTIKKDKNNQLTLKNIQDKYSLIIKEYPSSPSSEFAGFIYASYMYDNEKYDESSQLYENSIKNFQNDYLLLRLAAGGAGYSYMMKGDANKAQTFFEKISQSDKYISRDEALVNSGIIYRESGNSEKYIESFKKASELNKDSIYSGLIMEKAN